MTDEYLTKVIIDICYKTFYLISSEGEEQIVECENADQFMELFEMVNLAKEFDEEVQVVWCDPITTPAGVV